MVRVPGSAKKKKIFSLTFTVFAFLHSFLPESENNSSKTRGTTAPAVSKSKIIFKKVKTSETTAHAVIPVSQRL